MSMSIMKINKTYKYLKKSSLMNAYSTILALYLNLYKSRVTIYFHEQYNSVKLVYSSIE